MKTFKSFSRMQEWLRKEWLAGRDSQAKLVDGVNADYYFFAEVQGRCDAIPKPPAIRFVKGKSKNKGRCQIVVRTGWFEISVRDLKCILKKVSQVKVKAKQLGWHEEFPEPLRISVHQLDMWHHYGSNKVRRSRVRQWRWVSVYSTLNGFLVSSGCTQITHTAILAAIRKAKLQKEFGI